MQSGKRSPRKKLQIEISLPDSEPDGRYKIDLNHFSKKSIRSKKSLDAYVYSMACLIFQYNWKLIDENSGVIILQK